MRPLLLVLVAVAGGLGTAARFLVDDAVARRTRRSIPLGTFVVNATACLLLGMLTGWLLGRPSLHEVGAVLGVGFLGGYSTFSTASIEAARLLLAGRGGTALTHALGMLVVGVSAAVVGLALTR